MSDEYEDVGRCQALGTGTIVVQQPEVVAERFLRQTAQADSYPVQLGLLAKRMQLLVVEGDVDGTGYLMNFPDGYEVILRQGDSPGRKNFTAAHEMGHFYLERAVEIAKQPMAGSQPPPKVKEVSQEDVEDWCNKFASNLLMARQSLTKHFGGAEGVLNPRKVADGPKAFGVTLEAFLVRLREVYKVVTCSVSPGEPVRVYQIRPTALDTPAIRQACAAALTSPLGRQAAAGSILGARSMLLEGHQRLVLGVVPQTPT